MIVIRGINAPPWDKMVHCLLPCSLVWRRGLHHLRSHLLREPAFIQRISCCIKNTHSRKKRAPIPLYQLRVHEHYLTCVSGACGQENLSCYKR